MKAITVEPKKPGSARYEDFPEPEVREGSVLVEAVAVGVCGTDAEIVAGKYGWAPPGKTRLVLGHESTQGGGPRAFIIDPSGTLLVANQDTDTVVTFRINQDSGTLQATGHVAAVPTPVCLHLVSA